MSNQTCDDLSWRWRPMVTADVPLLTGLATVIHPNLPEDAAIFAERLALFPTGCFGLAADAALSGYAVAHPWRGEPPALDTLVGAIPAEPDHLYIHDVALLPEARGNGQGSVIVQRLLTLAAGRQLPAVRLVAVGGSVPFWERHGFRTQAKTPASYREGAAAMIR